MDFFLCKQLNQFLIRNKMKYKIMNAKNQIEHDNYIMLNVIKKNIFVNMNILYIILTWSIILFNKGYINSNFFK